MRIEYLKDSEYTLIDNPQQTRLGLIFVGYKNGNLRKTNRKITTSSLHRQDNRIYDCYGVYPTICSRTRNSFLLIK